MTKARLTLAAFWVLFGVFVLNVLLGKAAIAFGWELPLLSDVAEFLLLLVAMVVFVVAALQREAEREAKTEQPD